MFRYLILGLILKSFFFDQTGASVPQTVAWSLNPLKNCLIYGIIDLPVIASTLYLVAPLVLNVHHRVSYACSQNSDSAWDKVGESTIFLFSFTLSAKVWKIYLHVRMDESLMIPLEGNYISQGMTQKDVS